MADGPKTPISEIPVLHDHGQYLWHDRVVIIGNAQALARLRDAINDSLAGTDQKREFTVADGEGYYLTVRLRSAPFGDPAWDNCALPYFDSVANPPRTDKAEP